MSKKEEPSKDQLQLFEAAKADLPLRAPYARGSDTSKAAGQSVEICSGTLRARCLGHIVDRASYGMTCDELEAMSGLMHQTASARVYELHKLGAIYDSGRRRKTRSGRKATVWLARPLPEVDDAVEKETPC